MNETLTPQVEDKIENVALRYHLHWERLRTAGTGSSGMQVLYSVIPQYEVAMDDGEQSSMMRI